MRRSDDIALSDHLLRLLAETVDAERDAVAALQETRRLHPHADARRRAGGDDVARHQRHEAAGVADQFRNREDHGFRVAALQAFAVHFQPHVEPLWVRHLVAGDQPRADRAEGIATLALVPLRTALQLVFALRYVVDHAIASHIL